MDISLSISDDGVQKVVASHLPDLHHVARNGLETLLIVLAQ